MPLSSINEMMGIDEETFKNTTNKPILNKEKEGNT